MIDSFPALNAIPGLIHGFTTRAPGLAVDVDRATALARLDTCHQTALSELGLDHQSMARCRQVHGAKVIEVDPAWQPNATPLGEADALITSRSDISLGIYVADCCAVFAVDPNNRVIGLAHAGRNGAEKGVATALLQRMIAAAGDCADPGQMIVQLSPCIRPPAYEVDFAAEILQQCHQCGIPSGQVYDCGICTHQHPERYYSYRREHGQTGRMLAFMGWSA